MSTQTEKTQEWPIHPQFLSIREGVNKNDDGYSPNRDGLFFADELRGFMADASNASKIQNVLALFQVVPASFVCEDKEQRRDEFCPKEDQFIREILGNRKIIRIYPGELFPNITCCDLFRKCNQGNNAKKCLELDSRIALLYHKDLSEIDYNDQFDDFRQALEGIVTKYNEYLSKSNTTHARYSVKMLVCNDGKNLYVEYQCPYSKLNEYFFPVIYSGKVIAVLMQGQRCPKDLKREDMFAKYRKDSDKDTKSLNRSIEKLPNKFFIQADPMNLDRLKAIIERTNRLEDRIKDSINAITQQYVTITFQNVENDFRNRIKSIDVNNAEALGLFKNTLNTVLHSVFYAYNSDGFIRIYSIKSKIEDYDLSKDEFELIGDSSEYENSSDYSLLIFNKLPVNLVDFEKKELVEFIDPNFRNNIKEQDIFRLEAPFPSQRMAYIVWRRDDRWKEKYPNQYQMYLTALVSMYNTLLVRYFILTSIKLENLLEDSMRITTHAVAQIIPLVIDTINNKESLESIRESSPYSGSTKITIDATKIINVSNHLINLQNSFIQSKRTLDNESPKYNFINLHKKISDTVDLLIREAKYNNKQKISVKFNSDINRYELNTDSDFLSDILFNLIRNAIKYGLRGSRITLSVYFPDDSSKQEIKISIVNYGNIISENVRKNMYDLYYRAGENGKNRDGMGVGLFLVKKLCVLLGYSIDCSPSVIMADYNLPLKYYYVKQKPKFTEDTSLNQNLIHFLEERIPQELNEIINTDYMEWEITNREIIDTLIQPTYRNEFQITIPITDNLKLIQS